MTASGRFRHGLKWPPMAGSSSIPDTQVVPLTDSNRPEAEFRPADASVGFRLWLPTFASGCFPADQSRGGSSRRFLPRRQLP